MNQLINQHLQSMDFYVNFNLDEEFNETIKKILEILLLQQF